MRSLGDVLSQQPHLSRPRETRRYRGGAKFVMNLRDVSTPLDRNARARLLHQAEQLEKRSKSKGQRSGVLGLTGLAVLRCLLLRFQNRANGFCFPSYSSLQAELGFARQTIARALRALEACGLIRVVRRLVRRVVQRAGVEFVGVVQGSNIYSFVLGGLVPIHVAGTPARSRSFPKPSKMLALLIGQGRPPQGYELTREKLSYVGQQPESIR